MADQKSERVAFIVVGWNNCDLLPECFESIKQQTYRDSIIIYVDNDSSDNSVAYTKKHYPNIQVIEPRKNTGFAKGNNIGIMKALQDESVKYVALLNTDACLDAKWTQQIVTFAQQKPKAALLQGTTLDYYDHKVIDSTHIFVSHNGQGTQGNWRYYVTDEKGPRKVFGVNAAACLITRNFIEAQPFHDQLFDEALFMYLEDIDLAARATLMGWDNYLVPKAKAYHMGSASSSKNPNFSLYMTFRNNSCMLFKNFTFSMIVRMLPRLIRGDIDTIKTLRRRGKRQASYKVIKGRLIGLGRLPLFIKKRYTMNKNRSVDSKYLWILMRKGY